MQVNSDYEQVGGSNDESADRVENIYENITEEPMYENIYEKVNKNIADTVLTSSASHPKTATQGWTGHNTFFFLITL